MRKSRYLQEEKQREREGEGEEGGGEGEREREREREGEREGEREWEWKRGRPSVPSSHSQMISAEVPLMFSKAVEIFVTELSLRAWLHTEEAKRRTVQVKTSYLSHWCSSWIALHLVCFFILSLPHSSFPHPSLPPSLSL